MIIVVEVVVAVIMIIIVCKHPGHNQVIREICSAQIKLTLIRAHFCKSRWHTNTFNCFCF